MNNTAKTIFLFLLFVAAFALLPPTGLYRFSPTPPEAPAGPPALRIASPAPERQATALSPYGPGFEHELAERFCREQNCTPTWVPASSKEEALSLLHKGEVDLVAGFGGELPPQQAALNGTEPALLAAGRPYAHFRPIKVRLFQENAAETDAGAASEPLSAKDAPEADPGPPLSGEGQSEMPLFSAAMDLASGDPDTDVLLLDPASYSLWLPLAGKTRTERALSTLVPYRWFWRQDSPFADGLAGFWSGNRLDDFLALLMERYYAFLPKKLSAPDLLDLADMLSSRLPKYKDVIARAAGEYAVPPLLLVAVIYMESRFDPNAVSPTNVRGIMQLTRDTARMLGVDRNDPEQCIMGGAKYLRELWELTEGKAEDPWDRWFMALAAFNQGPGSLSGAIRISRQQGSSGLTWAELKTAYPRLVNSRGYEAVSFVEQVRYYYYILHGLVSLSPAEAQNLAPLLAARAAFVGSSGG